MVRGLVLLLLAFKACTAEFQPVTVYEQIRKSESSGVYPRPSRDEDPNAHRLRESIAVTKVQQVYEEKGYEDEGYDHGYSDEHGRSYKDYSRFPAPRSDAQEDYSDSPRRANKPPTRIRYFDSEPSHLKETIHRKRYTDDNDRDYQEDDDAITDENDEDEFDGDDEETAVEHITVPPSWKEETTKKKNFDKLANKEIDEFKRNFEKEWKEIKIGPELKEGLEKLKKEVKGGKPEELKKPKKETKTARNMKKKDKYNMFKYKPIRVPHTSIQGLGPFRPLVIGSKVIYPGQIAKIRKKDSMMGMHSTISMTTYPYKRVPGPPQPQIYKVQSQGSLTSTHVKRSPPLVRYPEFTPLPPNIFNLPHTSIPNTRTRSHSSVIKSPSSVNGFNLQSGFIPIFPGNNDSSQKLKVSSNDLSFSPQAVSNSNAQPGKSRGMKKATKENPTLPSSASKEAETKPQNLNRGHVKYIEKLTASHFAAPVKKQTFKPVPKIKQKQIKDLAMKLNSEHMTKDLTRTSSSYNKRFGRTGQRSINFDSNENKYPFYKQGETVALSEDSPLHYMRNPNLRPIKTNKNMVLYSEDESNPCADPNIPENILPKYKEGGEGVGNQNGPSAKHLGFDIECFKKKYFGDEPLDNPLFQEIKRNPVDTIKESDKVNVQRVRQKVGRTKRDVDLSKYHVVLTRQSRRPAYDYEDDEEHLDDAKTEETSHAETSTIAATSPSPVTKVTPSKLEETTTTNEVISAVPTIKHKFRSTTEKSKENSESGEESLEKLITVMARPVKRVHRPRHAYSSRYSSTRKPYSTAKPKSTPEPQTTTVRTTPQTQARPEPEPTEEGKVENKRMMLKQRIKFMIARPVKFSLVPSSSSQESTERIKTTTTTTEEPSTTSEPATSVTSRMYPPKRKILKLRKGPFNIFSVLNDGKSSTTKFPLTNYYSEAQMSSSETVETYEEPNNSSPEHTSTVHAVTEHPRRIKIRRPMPTHLREKKSSSQGEENLTNKTPLSETTNGGNDKNKFVSNKKERAVEVEFHQVLVQKVDPIEELSQVNPPMMINYAPSSTISPLVETSSQAEVKTRPTDDSNLYSVNATPAAGSWKKYKQEKIVRGKLRKRTEVRETTPATPPEGNESRIYERLEQHQANEEDLYKRRRRPTTSKPHFLPTSVYESYDKPTEISKNQAYVVGLMSQVIPKEVNSLGLPTAEIPDSLLASDEVGDDGGPIEVTGFGQEKHDAPTIAAYSEGDLISRSPIVVSSTTPEPQWKQEPVRFNDGHRRRRPIAEPTVAVSEVQHRRKPIRLTLTSTEVPEVKVNLMKKQTRWRKPSSTTPEPVSKQDELFETPRHIEEDSIEEPRWNPRGNDGEKVENTDEWTSTVTTQEPPKWKPVTIPEPVPWKSGSTGRPNLKTNRVINFEPTTENGKYLSSYYEGAEEQTNDSPAPVYETDEELTFNFDFQEPSSPVQSEQSHTKSSYNEEHKLLKETGQPQWTNPSYNEEPKLSVQTEEPPRVTTSYDVELTYQTDQPKRRRPSYNDESIHQVQNEQHKRRRPSYNEEPTYQVQNEQPKRRRPSYTDEAELPRETQQPHRGSLTYTDDKSELSRETHQPRRENPTYTDDSELPRETQQPHRENPTYTDESELPRETQQPHRENPSYTDESELSRETQQPHRENPSYTDESELPRETQQPHRGSLTYTDQYEVHDGETEESQRPSYNKDHSHLVQTVQSNRRKPSYNEEPKLPENEQSPWGIISSYTEETKPNVEEEQSLWRNPSYNEEPVIQVQTEPTQRRPAYDQSDVQHRRRRPSYKEEPKVSEKNQQSHWKRPSYNVEPTIQIQTESPKGRPVYEDELPEDRSVILIPTLIPVYPKLEEEPKPIGYNRNYEVNSNTNVETKTKQVEETTEQPKKRKPMHIIRKHKPKPETDELDDIISPAFNVETMEKRRKAHQKKSRDSTEAESSRSPQDSQLDESEAMSRRKKFLQNLLRPSIQRHKTTEQSDIHTAESSSGWTKDPRQRSYFYVND